MTCQIQSMEVWCARAGKETEAAVAAAHKACRRSDSQAHSQKAGNHANAGMQAKHQGAADLKGYDRALKQLQFAAPKRKRHEQ